MQHMIEWFDSMDRTITEQRRSEAKKHKAQRAWQKFKDRHPELELDVPHAAQLKGAQPHASVAARLRYPNIASHVANASASRCRSRSHKRLPSRASRSPPQERHKELLRELNKLQERGTPAHAEWPVGSHEGKLHEWLLGLDRGGGRFLEYFEALRIHFGADLSNIKKMQLHIPCAPGRLGTIDSYFWEICAVRGDFWEIWHNNTVYSMPPLGHRLVLAKGINALAETRGSCNA